MADFTINFPTNLSFQDYLHISHVARTWADGYDLKDPSRLHASLSRTLTIDYTGVVPSWGLKTYKRSDFISLWLSPEHLGLPPLATQHLLALPYFKSVTHDEGSGAWEAVVQWQIIASHGRRGEGEERGNPMARIVEESHHRGFLEHVFVKGGGGGERSGGDGAVGEEKEEEGWRIKTIRPSVIFQPGDFMSVRRPVEDD